MWRDEKGGRWSVGVGLVPDAQFDRVHAKVGREFVDRRFEREGADRFAGRAHEGVGEHVHPRHLHLQQHVGCGIGRARAEDEGLGHALCGVITVRPVWISASNLPSSVAPIATRCSVSVRPPTIR